MNLPPSRFSSSTGVQAVEKGLTQNPDDSSPSPSNGVGEPKKNRSGLVLFGVLIVAIGTIIGLVWMHYHPQLSPKHGTDSSLPANSGDAGSSATADTTTAVDQAPAPTVSAEPSPLPEATAQQTIVLPQSSPTTAGAKEDAGLPDAPVASQGSSDTQTDTDKMLQMMTVMNQSNLKTSDTSRQAIENSTRAIENSTRSMDMFLRQFASQQTGNAAANKALRDAIANYAQSVDTENQKINAAIKAGAINDDVINRIAQAVAAELWRKVNIGFSYTNGATGRLTTQPKKGERPMQFVLTPPPAPVKGPSAKAKLRTLN